MNSFVFIDKIVLRKYNLFVTKRNIFVTKIAKH